ncbi:MAG: class I SAM-dependent methyltransferase, partial [Candidatus Thiodiazotropha lotti]|nr:class I SAM-dependent methyltransferase [Candidatus Thiodiazotropha lotti]MCW4217747.1 class I SAM-dependent methyltransferase [Candidatus Thiodiazotropha lotti]
MTVDKSFGDLGPGGNQDPVVPDWRSMEIPDAWPDLSNFSSLGGVWSLLKLIAAKKRPTVELPEGMPGREMIPKYVLREFHNFPNGNYSKAMTRRYINNFDRFMLGEIKKLRKRLAAEFNGASRVLDIGCSGGGVAAELEALGVED